MWPGFESWRRRPPCVGWVCCWFCPLLREVFLRILRFSPLLKNQHFQIAVRSGTHGHVSTSSYELLSNPWVNKLQFTIYKKKIRKENLVRAWLSCRKPVSLCFFKDTAQSSAPYPVPYFVASRSSLQGLSALQVTWVGGLISVHSFSSTVAAWPDELTLTHFTSMAWTPAPQDVEHCKQSKNITIERKENLSINLWLELALWKSSLTFLSDRRNLDLFNCD